MRATLLTLALLVLAPVVPAQTIEIAGPAIVIDGDTLWVRGQEVRVHGVDAPRGLSGVPAR